MGERDKIIEILETLETAWLGMASDLEKIYGDKNTAAKAILLCRDGLHDAIHDIDDCLSGEG